MAKLNCSQATIEVLRTCTSWRLKCAVSAAAFELNSLQMETACGERSTFFKIADFFSTRPNAHTKLPSTSHRYDLVRLRCEWHNNWFWVAMICWPYFMTTTLNGCECELRYWQRSECERSPYAAVRCAMLARNEFTCVPWQQAFCDRYHQWKMNCNWIQLLEFVMWAHDTQ